MKFSGFDIGCIFYIQRMHDILVQAFFHFADDFLFLLRSLAKERTSLIS